MDFGWKKNYSRTFKPNKKLQSDGAQHLKEYAEATLGSGDLGLAVKLPEGEDQSEWVAVNTVDFYNQINMLYGTIQDHCTEVSCPLMTAGPKYEYHWSDGTAKPIKCSAPKYIELLMTWVQEQLEDEKIFPDKIGVPFPRNFMSICKNILKKLFRVYAHIYHCHFEIVIELGEEPHLNTSLKHFVYFCKEFLLIEHKQYAPLHDLIEKLTNKDKY